MNQPAFSTEIRMVPLSACAANETPAAATANNVVMMVRLSNDRIWFLRLRFAHKLTGIREKESAFRRREIPRAMDQNRCSVVGTRLRLFSAHRGIPPNESPENAIF